MQGAPCRRLSDVTQQKESSETAELLEDLEALLEELGIRLTSDRRVEGRGGFCLVHGEKRMIVNSRMLAAGKAELILEELSRLDLGNVFIAPALRERISAAGEREPGDEGLDE